MPKDIPEFLSLGETSRLLGVHRNTLRIWDKKRFLNPIRFGQRGDRRYKKEDILQFLKHTDKNRSAQESQEDNGVSKKTIERMVKLQSVTSALVGAVSIRDVAKVIVIDGAYALHAVSSVILLCSRKKKNLIVIASANYPSDLVQKMRIVSLRTSLPITDAVKHTKPALIETHEECLLRYPLSSFQSFAITNEAFAAIPIKMKGRVKGIWGFSFAQHTYFSKEDVTFMLSLAEQFSMALVRVGKYSRLYGKGNIAHDLTDLQIF